ncbi:MAG: hypothetical protein U1E45_05675 [Geminicoccaceae bacterium]
MSKLDELAREEAARRKRARPARGSARRGPPIDRPGDVDAEDGPQDTAALPDADEDGRPLIHVQAGKLHEFVGRLEEIFGHARAKRRPFVTLYRRAGAASLVRVVRLTDPRAAAGVHYPADTLLTLGVDAEYLRLLFSRAVGWQTWDRRRKPAKWVPSDPPMSVCRAFMAAAPWQKVPSLRGTVTAPTLRTDGTLLDKPGFDAATGLLFDPGGVRFPAINPRPSEKDARAALATVDALLTGFPFVSREARAVALSALLTGLVRRCLRSAPLFGFDAPKAGSGKTLLASLVAYVATGVAPALMNQAEKPEEERKRLLATLLDAPAVVCIDNVSRVLRSDALCTILTEPSWDDRVLGVSGNAKVSTNVTFLATGNNLRFFGDLGERALVCRIDAGVPEPGEREFGVNLHEEVPRRRPELVAACLTIMLAYTVAGSPATPGPRFGRFEDWSRMVRSPLLWLGCADPVRTREAVRAVDPERDALLPILAGWPFKKEQTAKEIVQMASSEDFLAALLAIAPTRGRDERPDATAVGRFLAKHLGRVEEVEVDGQRCRRRLSSPSVTRKGLRTYAVETEPVAEAVQADPAEVAARGGLE